MAKATVVALVPMKPLGKVKRRLRRVLDPRSRAALSLVMLDHVLQAIDESSAVTETRIIGGDAQILDLAKQHNASWYNDDGATLNSALERAAKKAFQDGANAIFIVPSDLGMLTATDVEFIVSASAELSQVVIAQAARDAGTNALLAPNGMFPKLRFGKNSFPSHVEACRIADISYTTVNRSGTAFDLDTPYGLGIYRAARPSLEADLAKWLRLIPEAQFEAQMEETRA